MDNGNDAQYPPVFKVWEEEGVIHLVLGPTGTIDPWVMKEVLRALHRVDPVGGAPVMVEQHDVVRMTPEAKLFLARVCDQHVRPVAYMAYDLPERIQGEFFLRFHRPRFPFRVFGAHDEALKWFCQFTSAFSVPS